MRRGLGRVQGGVQSLQSVCGRKACCPLHMATLHTYPFTSSRLPVRQAARSISASMPKTAAALSRYVPRTAPSNSPSSCPIATVAWPCLSTCSLLPWMFESAAIGSMQGRSFELRDFKIAAFVWWFCRAFCKVRLAAQSLGVSNSVFSDCGRGFCGLVGGVSGNV